MTDYRKGFEQLGPDTLRLRIGDRHAGYQGEQLRQAETWLKEHDEAVARRELINRRWMIAGAIAAIVAAVAGIIAAVTGVISTWPK